MTRRVNRSVRPALVHTLAVAARNLAVIGAFTTAAGCPLDPEVEGIGTACTVDGDVCPFDHTCIPNRIDAPNAGVCAPIADYGSCAAPTYSLRTQKTVDKDVVIEAAADVIDVEDVATITGYLQLRAPGAGGTLQLGDLCGFAGVQHVDGAVVVGETDLTSLDGLQNLAFVGGGVLVHSNRLLEDVQALAALVAVVQADDISLALINNPALGGDEIDDLRDALGQTAPSVNLVDCGNRDSSNQDCGGQLNSLLSLATRAQ